MLTFSPVEKKALYFGTQFVMKTTDGGLHWQEISPGPHRRHAERRGRKGGRTRHRAERARNAASVSCTALRLRLSRPMEIWAGSDTGLLHLTQDGGKSWQNVTPNGLSDWSKIAMIEASRFDPAVAYVAVDRHRLDDLTPCIYRTRDYGKSWQPIAAGIGRTFCQRDSRGHKHSLRAASVAQSFVTSLP